MQLFFKFRNVCFQLQIVFEDVIVPLEVPIIYAIHTCCCMEHLFGFVRLSGSVDAPVAVCFID